MAISLASASPVLAFLILLGAAAIFLRASPYIHRIFKRLCRGREISTGFSDQVQLGQIGEIQQSNSLVMHVQIDGDKQRRLRFEVARRDPEPLRWTRPGPILTHSMWLRA